MKYDFYIIKQRPFSAQWTSLFDASAGGSDLQNKNEYLEQIQKIFYKIPNFILHHKEIREHHKTMQQQLQHLLPISKVVW